MQRVLRSDFHEIFRVSSRRHPHDLFSESSTVTLPCSVTLSARCTMADNKHKSVPSELQLSSKWDVCLERAVINFGIGVVTAGLTGIVLTRAPGMRKAVMGFGGGCGVGYSWVLCSQDFKKQ